MNRAQPIQPANIRNIVAINQGRRPLTMEEPSAPPLAPSPFRARMKEGCLIVDTRSQSDFGRGHLPGSFNIQLSSPEFEQRVGWVVPLEAPLLLITESDEDVARALHAMAFVGLDQRVEGYLEGGLPGHGPEEIPLRRLPQIEVGDLEHRQKSGEPITVLDVREASEWDAGHIRGARHLSLRFLSDRLGELGIQPGDRTAVVCASGQRSSTGASILLRKGLRKVLNVSGGMNAWREAGLPTSEPGCEV